MSRRIFRNGGCYPKANLQDKRILRLPDMAVELYNDGGVYDVCRIIGSRHRLVGKLFGNKPLL